ncbi:MAG: GNAT family N-acetyltransferase [Bacteroidetes bacterium]|nr:GNAT family N-acetyltransferase [Bacteroidota bacterium]
MLSLKTPTEKEFFQIKNYIQVFELDDRVLQQHEFIAAFRNDELFGFGRLRQHADCIELCSLGVVTKHRRQGIGKAIVAELIKKSNSSIYLVCIIPDFFAPFGFQIIGTYPTAIQDKLNYCTQELIVPETYVVMQLQK